MSPLHLVGFVTLTLSFGGMPATATRRVATAPVLRLTPSPVVGGNAVTGTVTLAAAAPAAGTTLTITTSSITLAPLVNPRLGASSAVTSLTLLVPQGQTVATFRINTPGVPTPATATITATASSEVTNASLSIVPASVLSVVLNPASVTGGQPATATVTLDGKTPSTGSVPVTLSAAVTNLTLSSTSSAATVSVPPSVTVNAGASSATFAVTTTAVSNPASASVTASLGRSASASLIIAAPAPVAVQFSPDKILGGTSSTGTVVLNAPTPPEGIHVALTSSSASVIVPTSIAVPGGSDRQTFNASTTRVTSGIKVSVVAANAREATSRTGGTTVTMSDGSVRTIQPASATGFLVIDAPPSPASMLLGPALVIGGTPSTGTVVLTGVAPASGVVVGLTSSSTNATVPASITVPPGLDRQTFQITTLPVVASTQVTIATQRPPSTTSTTSISDGTSNTIQFGESRVVSAVLSVLEQPRVQSVVVQPSAVLGGGSASIAVNFSTSTTSISPEVFAAYAASIRLSTNHPEILQLPSSFSPGLSTTTTSGTTLTTTGGFIASATATTTPPTTDQSVSLTATMIASSASTSLLIRAPVPAIATFTLRPTTATGGTNIIASLAPSTANTTSQTVQLTTDHPDIVHVPTSVVLAPGRALSLTFSTTAVAAQTTVTITAIAGNQRVPVSVAVVP
jgi:hypothetical protein